MRKVKSKTRTKTKARKTLAKIKRNPLSRARRKVNRKKHPIKRAILIFGLLLIVVKVSVMAMANSNSWRAIDSAGNPTERLGHVAIWTGSKMIIWGGTSEPSGDLTNTGGIYDPRANSWQAMSTVGAPSPRSKFSTLWTGSKMIIWGGEKRDAVLNDGGIYDPAADTWESIPATSGSNTVDDLLDSDNLTSMPPRKEHSAVWTGSEMIIWGGRPNDSSTTNTGGIYNPATKTWRRVKLGGIKTPVGGLNPGQTAPKARYGHAAVWNGSKMIIWGGDDGWGEEYNDGGIYDPANGTWEKIETAGAPIGRYGNSAIWTGSELIVWGGQYFTSPDFKRRILGDGGSYNTTSKMWTNIPATATSPTPRFGHSAVWTGSEMIIWGGSDAINFSLPNRVNTGGVYNPAKGWRPTSLTNAPMPRHGHSAVWTGSEMIIWGGRDDVGMTNTSSAYTP